MSQREEDMVVFKSCPRCRGDLVLEAFPGDTEYACLQCGYRMPATKPRLTVSAYRKIDT